MNYGSAFHPYQEYSPILSRHVSKELHVGDLVSFKSAMIYSVFISLLKEAYSGTD